MDKPPVKSKGNRILKFLPKATSFSIPNPPPYSPGQDKAHLFRKGFSGPIVSIIPPEARLKPSGRGFEETPEPTSPKVSCIGQIKHKKKACCTWKDAAAVRTSPRGASPPRSHRKPRRFSLGRMFRGVAKSGRSRGRGAGAGPEANAKKPPLAPARVPPLGQLRRFASGRDVLANFDWKALGRVADESGPGYHSDDYLDDDHDDDSEGDEVFIPHSAPMLLGGGGAMEPRKEVNLWKRRTMVPPRPLKLE